MERLHHGAADKMPAWSRLLEVHLQQALALADVPGVRRVVPLLRALSHGVQPRRRHVLDGEALRPPGASPPSSAAADSIRHDVRGRSRRRKMPGQSRKGLCTVADGAPSRWPSDCGKLTTGPTCFGITVVPAQTCSWEVAVQTVSPGVRCLDALT